MHTLKLTISLGLRMLTCTDFLKCTDTCICYDNVIGVGLDFELWLVPPAAYQHRNKSILTKALDAALTTATDENAVVMARCLIRIKVTQDSESDKVDITTIIRWVMHFFQESECHGPRQLSIRHLAWLCPSYGMYVCVCTSINWVGWLPVPVDESCTSWTERNILTFET